MAVPGRGLAGGRGQPRVRVRGHGSGLGAAVPIPDRACAGRRVSGGDEVAGRLVSDRPRICDRGAGGSVDRGVGTPLPVPRDRRGVRARLARRRGERQRRGGHRRPAGCRDGHGRAVRHTSTEVQPGRGKARILGAVRAAGQPRLSRPHVGAICDVDLDPGLLRGEFRGGRNVRSGAGRVRGVRRGRRRRDRVRGRRPRRRSSRPDRADDDRHGAQWIQRTADRLPVRCATGPDAAPGDRVGDHSRRRFQRSSRRRSRSSVRPGPRGRRWRSRPLPGSC